MRKTKIVATIGPSSFDYAIMKKMVQAGLNVIRINLSHSRLGDMDEIVKNVKKIRKELSVPLPIMIDTRGPEIRVKIFEAGEAQIKKGQTFTFTEKILLGNETVVSLNMTGIAKSVKAGDKILACDGLIGFKVMKVDGKDIICRAENSGTIYNRKSLFIPGVKFKIPYLNDADKKDILWAIENDVDLIAASFVNSKNDVLVLRKFIEDNNGDMKIISKIESQCGVDNIDEIIEVTDAIMVARGDLGVEVPIERLPYIQKTIIKKAVSKGKAVITATEMLESMINNNRPTRAEVTDIANAVFDGTSCVMLSGETAMGKYPVEAIKTMSRVAENAELHINYNNQFNKPVNVELLNTTDIISYSAVDASFMNNIKAIVSFTSSGLSVGLISRFRPSKTIIGATFNEKTYRQMELIWGVVPIKTPAYNTTDEMFKIAGKHCLEHKFAKRGDLIVITCGTPKKSTGTNLIRIAEIED